MAKVKITQVRSAIDQSERNKKTLQALGLRKINGTVEKDLNPQIQGMISRVHHLISVENV